MVHYCEFNLCNSIDKSQNKLLCMIYVWHMKSIIMTNLVSYYCWLLFFFKNIFSRFLVIVLYLY